MKVRRIILIIFVIYGIASCTALRAQGFGSLSDCLITEDIGVYRFDSNEANMGSDYTASGVVGLTGHFNDHMHTVCTGHYTSSNINELQGLPVEEKYNRLIVIGVSVQVTLHSGSDSDRWLLHEVESSFRGREKEGRLGESLHESASIREIDGHKIFDYGNVDYRWISNYIVVYIHYTDLTGTKPEPLEVVRAYLGKFPSSITMTDAEVKSKAHNEQWLRDEMERRVWLSEKWIARIKSIVNSPESIVQGLGDVREHLEVFLRYREKYLGVKITDKEMSGLYKAEEKRDVGGMEERVKAYREWWEGNKTKELQNVPGQ